MDNDKIKKEENKQGNIKIKMKLKKCEKFNCL